MCFVFIYFCCKNLFLAPVRQTTTQFIQDMFFYFSWLGTNMNVNVHYLHSHLNHFSKNLGDLSKEQGERFPQNIQTMDAV